MHLIRFEGLADNFINALYPYLKNEIDPFPVRNKNIKKITLQPKLSSDILEKVYIKHKDMFDAGYYSIDDSLNWGD